MQLYNRVINVKSKPFHPLKIKFRANSNMLLLRRSKFLNLNQFFNIKPYQLLLLLWQLFFQILKFRYKQIKRFIRKLKFRFHLKWIFLFWFLRRTSSLNRYSPTLSICLNRLCDLIIRWFFWKKYNFNVTLNNFTIFLVLNMNVNRD